jgi:hypothetical protein
MRKSVAIVIVIVASLAGGRVLLCSVMPSLQNPEMAPRWALANLVTSDSAASVTSVLQEEIPFIELSTQVLSELPQPKDLENLSDEEVHGTPTVVREAGERLGEIAERVAKNPELREQAKEFYMACAEDDRTLQSVRALCYSHLPELLSLEDLKRVRVTPELRTLAGRLISHPG